jgi:hypothetical protein
MYFMGGMHGPVGVPTLYIVEVIHRRGFKIKGLILILKIKAF